VIASEWGAGSNFMDPRLPLLVQCSRKLYFQYFTDASVSLVQRPLARPQRSFSAFPWHAPEARSAGSERKASFLVFFFFLFSSQDHGAI